MKNVTPIDPPPERELKSIQAHQVVIAESRRITHHIALDAGTPLTDLLVPDFWTLSASKLHRRDLIEVEPMDGSWWALLLVISTGPEFAELAILQKIDLPAKPRTADDLPLGHSVFFLGSTRLWAALRGEQILKCYFSTKDAAIEWLIESTRS